MLLTNYSSRRRFIPGGAPSWVPDGAIFHLDFLQGLYWSGGQGREIDTLLGDGPNTTQAGGGFNPAAIVPSGMLISNNGNINAETEAAWTNRPNAIGTLYDELSAALFGGGTLVYDMQFEFTPYGTLFGFYDDISDDDAFDWVSLDGSALSDGYDLYIGAPGDDSLSDLSPGLHRIAVTLNRDSGGGNREYAISVDGGTALTGTTSASGNPAGYPADPFPTSDLVAITIGHDGDDAVMMDVAYFRTLTLYPAKTPAELPALSA